MTWEKTGNIAVTHGSNMVAGSGTKFATAVRLGDAFQGPDGDWYEIVNVLGDTQLTLSPAYNGATVTNASYAVAPVQGYVKAAADRLRAVTDNMAGVEVSLKAAQLAQAGAEAAEQTTLSARDSAVAARQGAADSAATSSAASGKAGASASSASAYASAAAGSADTAQVAAGSATQAKTSAAASAAAAAQSERNVANKASNGANSDITSLAGLTTPLSVPQGGTGGAGIVQPNTADANTLVASGFNYIFNNGGINIPENVGYLEVKIHSTSGYLKQIFYGMGTDNVWTRRCFAGVWSAWALNYGRANTLGPVSQVGGAPTGALIERGSNANGQWTKFADGTLICFGTLPNLSVAANSVTQLSINFPTRFADTGYAIQVNGAPNASTDVYGFVYLSGKALDSTSAVFRNGADAQSIVLIAYSAIGRWF